MNEGSLKALVRTSPKVSSSSALLATTGARIIGSIKREARMIAAKVTRTICQLIMVINHSAVGAPITCPADPAAVAMASAIERFSSDAARPTTARITPNPVPAIPKPIRML